VNTLGGLVEAVQLVCSQELQGELLRADIAELVHTVAGGVHGIAFINLIQHSAEALELMLDFICRVVPVELCLEVLELDFIVVQAPSRHSDNDGN